MNWLDILFAVLVVAGFIKGYRDGFVRQIVLFFALIAAIYLCSKVAVKIGAYLLSTDWFPEYSVAIMSYIVAFVMIAGIIIMAGGIIHKMISVTPLSLLNHLAGALLGLIMTMLFISLTLNVVEKFDRHTALIPMETKMESRFYFYFKNIVPAIYPVDLFIWKEEME